ncbi:EamA family transporter RarD [Anaeromyxobacter sp. Fw109-5]|uniref:EamA family transporter RarD n=1 Tax=Anaeromyxobacter sp. (strain Fw109-5) TaxID=404589 RepID=UPI0000ED7F49|nr:EamA family transporter RarD [Anaeromyxobacter sp. Fw109-5]ABS25016.1 RarD protein, DMT superfamily transporter [Anaeromyxobacter sp. Fw109-5]
MTSPSSRDERSAGLAYALAAYLSWGLLPLYFKALKHVPAPEILAHRVVWSLVLLAALLAVRGEQGAFTAPFRGGRWRILAATTTLISTNWLVYIWAVNAGRIVEASLGYFMNPLVNVLLGVAFLGETLSGRQRAAIGLAAAGVLVLVLRAGTFPWVSLVLATSFGVYGLVRKRAAIEAVGGLFAETALLAPLALAFLGVRAAGGAGAFGSTPGTTVLLAAAGVITALPLVWFTLGVHRLRLSTMGLVQYIAPTGQFLLGVALYREPFTRPHAAAFGLIWASLALYTWDALGRLRPIER